MIGGLERKSFVFMKFQEIGGLAELVALFAAALFLDVAELVERLLELAREAGAIEAEDGDLFDCGTRVREHVGFQARDAIQAPACFGDFLDELDLGGIGGLKLIAKLAAVLLVGCRVFGRQNSALGGKPVTKGVAGGSLLALGGTRSGGFLSIQAIDGRAENGNSS